MEKTQMRVDYIEAMKAIKGALDDADLAKQVFADANALDRQGILLNANARLEFSKQVAQISLNAQDSAKEFGLQTLKWLFLINAGAVALILAYVGGKAPEVKPLVAAKVTGPIFVFASGCVLVAIAGAAGYLNFMSGGQSLPAPSTLYQFVDPSKAEWPKPRSQNGNESDSEFAKRINRQLSITQNSAIAAASISALLFAIGVFWAVVTLL